MICVLSSPNLSLVQSLGLSLKPLSGDSLSLSLSLTHSLTHTFFFLCSTSPSFVIVVQLSSLSLLLKNHASQLSTANRSLEGTRKWFAWNSKKRYIELLSATKLLRSAGASTSGQRVVTTLLPESRKPLARCYPYSTPLYSYLQNILHCMWGSTILLHIRKDTLGESL